MDARKAIKKQFMKEYSRKDFTAITIKGLCAATPVARTTFYSYYNNTNDVKEEIETELINGLIYVSQTVSGGNLPNMDFPTFMDAVEAFIKDHWSDIFAFLVCQPNLRFMRKWKDAIKANFRMRYPEKVQSGNYEAVAEMVATSMVSAYAYWMEYPDTVSTKDIKPLLHKVLESLVDLI